MYSPPQVSIVIPVYNGSNYLREAIDSALAQTYPNIEIVVVNDGSTDDGATEEIAKSYGEKIRYFSKENGGVSTALNMGIDVMGGEYFSWLSHDDIYEPNKIEIEIEAVRKENQKVIVYSDYFFIDERSNKFKIINLPNVPWGGMRAFIAGSHMIHGCTLLIPREFLINSGGFSKLLKTTQDQDLFFRLAAHYQFIHVSLPLVGARMHMQQGSEKLKGLCLDEQDELYLGFVSDLNDNEAYIYSGGTVASYYLRLYMIFRIANFHRAATVASNKFFTALKKEPHRIRLLAWFILLYLAPMQLLRKTWRWALHWLRGHGNNKAVRFLLAEIEKWRG